MFKKTRWGNSINLLLFLSLTSASAIAEPPPLYLFVDISVLVEPGQSDLFAVNRFGYAVGTAVMEDRLGAYLYSPDSTITALGSLGSSSNAFSINDMGTVVGVTGSRPFIRTPSDGMRYLPTPNDANGQARSINSKGTIVGSYELSGSSRAALWQDKQLIDLGTLGFMSIAYSINDLDQVVGYSRIRCSSLSVSAHAFFWRDGVMHDLGLPEGTNYSHAYDINNKEQIVGVAVLGRECNSPALAGMRAYLWENGKATNIHTLTTKSGSAALAINDQGVVVGSLHNGNLDAGIFYWQNGTMYDLVDERYVVNPPSWPLTRAMDINDDRVIVGYGLDLCDTGPCTKAFMLVPLP